MTKYFGLILLWTTLAGVASFSTSASFIQADPTDDLSLTLGHAPEAEAYTLISEKRVAEIFEDQLDLFPKSQAPKLAHHLVSLCRQYRFDPAFVLALIKVESGFHVKAKSPVGALGLMQLMPPTAQFIAHEIANPLLPKSGRKKITPRSLMDPFVNISLGVAYLAWLRGHYSGYPPYYLVAAYNVGPARLDELRAQKNFKPVATKLYYDRIRQGVPKFRFYRRFEEVNAGV